MFYFIVFCLADLLQSNLLIDFLQSFTLCKFAAITVLFLGGGPWSYCMEIILSKLQKSYNVSLVFLWIKVFFASMLRRSLFFIWTLEWSGKMEHAIERTLEWDSHGQMEPSSANYGPVQLIPMVTQMKDQALCISSCSFSIHYLFIWKCTPFSWASQKCHLREMASSGKLCVKNQSLWEKNITDEDLIWKTDIVCYYSYSTCFVEVKKNK